MGIPDPEIARPEPLPEEFQNSSPRQTTRCCFCFPSFSRRSLWHRVSSSSSHGGANEFNQHRWWERGIHALKKLREWSELVAGPKWKTFIRRFNRNNNGSGNGRLGKFQYDALSYALNFDEGQNGNMEEGDDYVALRNFSSRYAPVAMRGEREVAVVG